MRSDRADPASIEVLLHIPGYICVVNKPHDLRIDGNVQCTAEKLVEQEVRRLEPDQFINPSDGFGVRLVHQLDFATSGVLCFALSKKAAAELHALFSHRSAKKTYLALVWGHMTEDQYVFSSPIYEPPGDCIRVALGTPQHPGRCAVTHAYVGYRALYANKPVTYVVLRPTTGRRHQLRVHLASAGYPIVGDLNYSNDQASPRMMLHAWALSLPRSEQPLNIQSPDPFKALLSDSVPSALVSVGGLEMKELLLPVELPDYEKEFAIAGVLPYCFVSGELQFLLSVQPRRNWTPMKIKISDVDRTNDDEAKSGAKKRQKLDPDLERVDLLVAGDGGKLLSAKGTNLACFVTPRSESEVDSFLCAARALFVDTMFGFAPNVGELRADQFALMQYANQLRTGNDCIVLKLRSQFGSTALPDVPRSSGKGKQPTSSPWPRIVVYCAPVPFIPADQITARLTSFHSASKAKRKELAGISLQPGGKNFFWVSVATLLGDQKTSGMPPRDPVLERLGGSTEFRRLVASIKSLPQIPPSVETTQVVDDSLPLSFFPASECVRLRALSAQAAKVKHVTVDVL